MAEPARKPPQGPPGAYPVNPLPPVVVALFLVIAGIELIFSLGARGILGGPQAVGWRLEAVQKYAFSSEILKFMWQTGTWPAEHLMRFVTYPFVHASFTQTLFSCVFILALGKMVGEVFGNLATLAVFVLSAIGGALIYAVVLGSPAPLLGAFPAAYGLIGAYTYLLWLRAGAMGTRQLAAFRLIGFLMGIQLVFGLLFGGQNDWLADVGGFITGFAASFVLSPGGWTRLLRRIRKD